ncbi:Multicopper oxidase type 2 [Penicillium argentinense]|uniref:Multicopper oxidase type 2 n=1 Tax=Penicillium argentinense TaxID=1131581 RepID=A0A9W9FGD6_9EURO|nr:Multicopper oxidase type 2 [Penicillium argentinense]KAJ5099639.1 Multicopper oxidase type 2 [Penicillium argentinense]
MAPIKTLLTLASSGLIPLAWAKQVHFDLDLTWQKGAPDGNVRDMVFMNEQFPGPELRLSEGDDVEVVVHNHLPFNTSIHFHGIEQRGTPWSDGVPGLTQKPIQPGHSWTYRWTATQYGTYWYHAHAQSEIMDGLYGAIWISPAPQTPDPFHFISNNPTDIAAMKKAEQDPQLIMLSDWDHLTAAEYQKVQEDTGVNIFCSDSILINGRGAVYCPGTANISSVELPYLSTAINNQPLTDKGCLPNIYETQGNFPPTHPEKIPPGLNSGCTPTVGLHEIIEVDPQVGWVSLKFISAASLKALMFSIDEHPMYIYEVDGAYIEPQLAESVAIFNGERYAAMIKLDKPHKDYTIRVPDTQGDQVISGFATMRYKGSENTGPSAPYLDYGGRNTSAAVVALDNRAIRPYPPVSIPDHADQLVNLTLGRLGSSYTWTASGNALYDMMANWDDPILYDLNAKNKLAEQVTIQTKNGTWVDLILQLGSMPHTPAIQAPHVMHKHSNKAFILGVGPGFFNWASTEDAIAAHPEYFQLDNPQRRDTFVTQGPTGPSWMIVRYQVVNPGPFLLHCHIETHMSNGMAVALLDGVDAWPQIPPGEDQSPGGWQGPPPGQGVGQGQGAGQSQGTGQGQSASQGQSAGQGQDQSASMSSWWASHSQTLTPASVKPSSTPLLTSTSSPQPPPQIPPISTSRPPSPPTPTQATPPTAPQVTPEIEDYGEWYQARELKMMSILGNKISERLDAESARETQSVRRARHH